MNQIKVNTTYELLLLLLKKENHQRGMAKEIKTSLTSVQNSLKELRNLNVVDYRIEGKNHIYFIKKNIISKSLILNAENYKLIKLLTKHPHLSIIFKELVMKSKNSIILLFGSYAKGLEKKESDIDVYIETSNQEIKKKSEEIYPSLSIKIGEFNKEDLLIKEIIKNHIIINNGERYYEKLEIFE